MPRKTKEQAEKNTTEKEVKKANTKTKTTAKKTSSKAKVAKSEKKASTAKKSSASSKSKKATTNKVASTTKKTETKKTTATKKATSTKKSSTVKKATTTKKVAVPIVEYYDLPYRYNQTIVKLLSQTPTTLFVYWDISDKDRENYKKAFGENFFEETKPVLIIHNTTLNYSFEVEINDFANSWYLHVNDSKCNYEIELGRRPISREKQSEINTDYIYISSSNVIESPNDRILFNNTEHKAYFRNLKTNVTSTKSISFIRSMGKIYNIYDLYKTLYKDEILKDIEDDLPSSMFK